MLEEELKLKAKEYAELENSNCPTNDYYGFLNGWKSCMDYLIENQVL